MKVVYEYSHLGGSEILKVNYPSQNQEIYDVIAAVRAQRTKKSKEKTMKGRMLYSPKAINKEFKEAFGERGYREIRDKYTITIPGSDISIKGAFKQVDFVKDKIFIEVQMGKYAFMFYDVAKFQYFFNDGKAKVGVEIVPAHSLQTEMSSGVSYGEALIYDIERLKRHFPSVPIKVMLIDDDSVEGLHRVLDSSE